MGQTHGRHRFDSVDNTPTVWYADATFAIKAGIHSYTQSYIQASLAWVSGNTGVNISVETTVDVADSTLLTGRSRYTCVRGVVQRIFVQ